MMTEPEMNLAKALGYDAHSVGWVCPVCGGGVRPLVDRCPCVLLVRKDAPQLISTVSLAAPPQINSK